MKIQKNAGISLIASIIIVAIIIVGGVAIVKASKKAQIETERMEEQREEVRATKESFKEGLLGLKNVLASELDVDAKLAAALELADALNTTLDDVKVKIDADTQKEIDALQKKLAELRTKIEAGAENIVDDIDGFVADIEASIEADLVEGDDDHSDDEMNEDSDEEMMEDDSDDVADSDEEMMEDDSDVSAETPVNGNETGVEVEVSEDTQVQ